MRNISYSQNDNWQRLLPRWVIIALGCLFVAGLTAVRLLYQGLFPQALWLGNLVSAVILAALLAALTALLIGRFFNLSTSVGLMPLLLNLFYLFDPVVSPVDGRFLFLASIWLTALFLAHQQGMLKRWPWLPFVFIISFLLPIYLLTMGQTVGTADTFEFQVVIPQLGIVHPTGYPLYLLLTKLFTFIPINSAAWRINFGTAVYALGAACLLYIFLKTVTKQRLVPILAAILFGLTPTFWSQAVQAEVYTLHALIVAGVLWGMGIGDQGSGGDRRGLGVAFLLGLGLTNHLTTLVLLPPVLLFYFVREERAWARDPKPYVKALLRAAVVSLLPLMLYLYLPLRWQAVNGEPMGAGRFLDWVVGGRFQGALQLMAWIEDTARYGVVGRLFTAEWGWLHLAVAFLGLIVLVRRKWSAALFLGLTWLGFSFYALSYYVPDLSVFLIPAHMMVAVFWGSDVAAVVGFLVKNRRVGSWLIYPLLTLLMFFVFQQAVDTWKGVDASASDGQTAWGRAVLAQPLAPEGAILADSLKFPPLYYLQQAEGLRPDMDIMVLPDEAAYRAELDGRLAVGQTVYLARFLPGLAGVYHLRSVGPLTEASSQPLITLPASADIVEAEMSFGSIELSGFELEMDSPYADGESAVTFYWKAVEPVEPVWQVYVRWVGQGYQGPVVSQHPANNSYPTNAWRVGEIVADFHTLLRPILNETTELDLQVALAPAFTALEALDWQTVTAVRWEPTIELADSADLRVQVGPLLLDGLSMPGQIRPQSELAVQLHGFGASPESLSLQLQPIDRERPALMNNSSGSAFVDDPFTWSYEVATDVAPGWYQLVASYPNQDAVCSWLARKTMGCVLGEIEVSGVPLPEGAINFEDKVALLDVVIPEKRLQPGGQLALTLNWQGLSQMQADYTVFIQVLDEQDRIVGQIDSWPLQGTFPTSQWAVGERVDDPYLVRLSEDLPPGQYRLHVGWYLLETLRRLPVVDERGTAVDDKFVVSLDAIN